MKGMKINTKFYLEELQCDWETHSGETYSSIMYPIRWTRQEEGIA